MKNEEKTDFFTIIRSVKHPNTSQNIQQIVSHEHALYKTNENGSFVTLQNVFTRTQWQAWVQAVKSHFNIEQLGDVTTIWGIA